MDIAVSMKFGGEIVTAEECTELSYLELGLLCPNCRDVVMFAPAIERQYKSGVYPVKAHFRHFPTKDKEEAASCESRVSAITPKEKEKIKRQASNQRSRLFRRWFWMILEAHLLRSDIDPVKREVLYGTGEYKGFVAAGELADLIDDFSRYVPSICDKSIDFLGSVSNFDFPKSEKFVSGNHENDDLRIAFYQRAKLLSEQRLHKDIVREALFFLGAKNNRSTLQSLMLFWLIGSDIGDLENQKECFAMCLAKIGEMVALIPWYEEFERIKAGDDLPEPQKGFIGLMHLYITKIQIQVKLAGISLEHLREEDLKKMTAAERMEVFGEDFLAVLKSVRAEE